MLGPISLSGLLRVGNDIAETFVGACSCAILIEIAFQFDVMLSFHRQMSGLIFGCDR